MISRLLALRLFEAFSIQRWNDRIRPVALNEMDKQGFKSMLTFLIAKLEEHKGTKVDWDYLIYGSLFALMKNIVLSDIKAPVIARIKQDHPKAYKDLNRWVVNQYESLVDNELLERFERFLNVEDDPSNVNLRIIRAAHKYSTYREFEIIKASNASSPQLETIQKELDADIKQYLDLEGLSDLYTKQNLFEAACLIEQLRFQIRWSQTPRIPVTSVLGHSMLVAALMLLLSRELGACKSRIYNNFYGGLFHDLPEAVVRDIISPVKRATKDLPGIVREIETDVCQTELFSKMPECITADLRYFSGFDMPTADEYSDRIRLQGKAVPISGDESIAQFNSDEYSPLDGRLLKLADEIGAFLEANQSIQHGVTSRHLQEGMFRIRLKYLDKGYLCGLDVKSFFLEFD